ncbi:hypothetical protein B0G76_5983 [Paraburkholderia sp. BL23I1N1]|uniref:hypothetical protein n=1 Tax=Paraburkholderia sp. BL23I1N1 TaxID=1938802 RepID=UPI000FF5C954|nr:hypothetical protein [Paraburkholderia sp. BL23I1N1]RKE39551.1 hypothetical protein B0G76_5983 [Paraburkholderia sp. BL23I1N1]
MKNGLIAWLTIFATPLTSSALYACPEGCVDVAMVRPLDARSTILVSGMPVQRGELAHVTYVPSSPTRVWSSYPALPNAEGYRDGRRTRLHGDSFEWPQRDDGK